jgi:hypothetical protein
MIQAAALAEKVAAFRHPKLSAVRLAGELNRKPMDGATLDELLARINTELTKLGPILDVEVVREPEGSRTERGSWGSEPPNRPADEPINASGPGAWAGQYSAAGWPAERGARSGGRVASITMKPAARCTPICGR